MAKRQGARQGVGPVGPPLSLGLSRSVQGNPVVAENLRALPPAPVPPFTAALGHPVIWPLSDNASVVRSVITTTQRCTGAGPRRLRACHVVGM